ncbi:S9 family peptidase [uncultured Tessaracoccus sp.]|uniref:S9 family peptidase n=1 Tax=uncultured Tessaracoccus sp. TaxID=905023 RepID=UPI0026078CC9|nr:S9 family peptidase [uncultured Tessaracoccus sp.]
MRPEQLEDLVSLSAPTLHPDGAFAVVAVSHPSFAVDAEVGQLWRVPLDGGRPRRITRGFRDTAPRFSPDGTLLAFVRSQPGKPGQLFIAPADGGEPMQITDQKLGVGAFEFSDDSRRIVFIARVPEDGRYGTVDDIDAAHESPRAFSDFQTRHNGVGWFRDRPAQVFVVDVPDPAAEPIFEPTGQGKLHDVDVPAPFPETTRLTDDDIDWASPIFDADGSVLASANRKGDDTLECELWRLREGAKPESLTAGLSLSARGPRRSGGRLFFVAGSVGEGVDFVGHHGTVWLAGDAPRQVVDITVGGPLVSLGDGRVVVPEVYRGTERAVIVSDGDHQFIEDPTWDVQALAAAGGVIVATVTSATSTGELAVLRDGRWQVLTNFGAALADATLPHAVTAQAPDGYPVEGWLLKPTGRGPHPVLLMIHGGPYHGYTRSFFDEAQVAVEAGYAVVMCNPRGSWGFGTEHGRAIKGDMGNLDAADVLAFLEHCLAGDDALDGERLGIMGGSYGGYLTAWIIGHDHRFRGAIVDRGFLDVQSFVGSSDIGWFFPQEYTSYDKAEADRQSPMTYASEVRTPTLVIHSEDDLRCPLHQGLQYHALLKQAGVDAEMLVFPGENHELTRSGTPWHRRQRFEAVMAFWEKHLPVA